MFRTVLFLASLDDESFFAIVDQRIVGFSILFGILLLTVQGTEPRALRATTIWEF